MVSHQQQYHVNPTQLGAPEKLLWGLTARQLFILALGCSLGYRLWAACAFLLASSIAGFGTRLLLAALPVLLALALATIQLGGRYLEIWAVLLLRYACKQKQAVWCSVRVKDRYALASARERRVMGNDSATGEEGE
jgi:hypothetical protein